ncbi:neuraminidase-like domain-containing protein [Mycobacterium heidelbergense]|uniref:Tc toxin subunit A-related protein n=1 Tax=Mycobacterium heidelbergense TaxID=53376 RepID=UPI003CECE73E
MNDAARDLSIGASGADVRQLHAQMLDRGASIGRDELVEGFFGASTRRELIAIQHRLDLAATGIADADTLAALARGKDIEHRSYVVGFVVGPDHRPASHLQIRALDRDLRSSQLLGDTTTGDDGFYLVRYTPERAHNLEIGTADVYVQVLDRDRLLYETPLEQTVFNAAALVSITVELPTAVAPEHSEYERLTALIEPLLGQLSWAELTENDRHRDITFLQGETGVDHDRITWLVLAHRLATLIDISPYFFYALFTQQTLAAAQNWASLTPRLQLSVTTPLEPLLYDIVLLPAADVESAVRVATSTFIVPAALLEELPTIRKLLDEHRQQAQSWVSQQRTRVINSHIAHLLQSDVSEQLKAIIAADPLGDLPSVLTKLADLNLVPTDPATTDIANTLSITDILGEDPHTIDAVQKRFGITGENPHRLAELTPEDWASAIGGDNPAAHQQGAVMAARMAARYPTTAFAAQLAADPNPPLPHAAAVADTLASHPEFDLATGNITTLLAQHTEPVDTDTAATVRTAQRVYRLAPTYTHTKSLLERGISSAAAVMRQGQKRFVRDAVQSADFTTEQANQTFRTAANVHTASLIVAGQLQGAAAATLVPALAPQPARIEPVVKDFPNMKSLFAAINMSECTDCRSVHGAAAYLADVLQFLGDRLVVDTTSGSPAPLKGARDVLLARRPDLAVTDLNCANTNTTLPYLDVVCELLEDAVAPDAGLLYTGPVAPGTISADLLNALTGAGLAFTDTAIIYGPDLDNGYVVRDTAAVVGLTPDGGNWRARVLRQTFGSADELAAAPEYVNTDAYQTLVASTWCFTLPFDLAHQETRRYFAQFDIDRAELMRRLQVGGAPSDAACAAESLGLSDAQRILTVTANPAAQQTIWNTPTTPASDTLSHVDKFVTRAEITYQDLLELLDLGWVDGGQDLFIQHLDSTADLSQKRIVNLNDTALDRIHRFIRARTATGWPSPTVDRAIRSTAGGNGTLNDACLIDFTAITTAAARLSLTVDDTLDLLETLDVDDPAGAYAATFLNPVRTGAVDAHFEPKAIHANEAAEAGSPGSGIKLAAAATYLGLALGTTPADTTLLIAAAGANAALTAASISTTYALSRLATALGLSVGAVTDLVAIVGTNPLSSAAQLAAFADTAATMTASALPISTWRYLLRHEADDLAALDMPGAAITSLLNDLHKSYTTAKTADSLQLPADGTPTESTALVRPFLARLPGITADTLSQMQTLLTDTWANTTVTESAFIDATVGSYVDPATGTKLDTTAIQTALAARAANPTDATSNAVIAAVADAVGTYLYDTDRQAALTTAIATTFALDEDLTWDLLTTARLKEPPTAGQPPLSQILLDETTTPAAADLQQRAVQLLHTMTLAIGKLGLSAPTLTWLLANAHALGWLELDHLPYQPAQPATGLPAWRQLQGFLDMAAAYPDVANPADAQTPYTLTGFFDTVLKPATAAKLLTYLATLTGTDPATLIDLDTHLGLSTPDVSAYHNPATTAGILDTLAMLRTLGLDMATAVQVTKPVLDLTDAAGMRRALKSRYPDNQWLGVLKQIQDPLREMKRDALVAYLLADNPDLTSVDDLYDYFLIDTQMTACMSTSRIVQGHATVQLFAMRCLMGVEPKSVASVGTDDGWTQWDWMANFRVWEANRKIFLWPENWILPDLRDNKSELFIAFENTLHQNQLTDDTISDAIDTYLEGLDDIAHLDVMAAYYDTAREAEHVFARTRGGTPAVYYHREFQKERAWTPWEKVPLDIKGDQLLAFSRNSRLTIAWPEFTKEPDDTSDPPPIPDPDNLKTSGGTPTKKPAHRWKIQLAVSEYADGRWREKRVSDTALYAPDPTNYYDSSDFPDQDQFTMLVWGLGENQAVSCFQQVGSATEYTQGAPQQLSLIGSFALTGCKGVPEANQGGVMPAWLYPEFVPTALEAGRFQETGGLDKELAIVAMAGQTPQQIFGRTPAGLYEVTYPLQLTVIDWILLLIELWAIASSQSSLTARTFMSRRSAVAIPTGTLLPYFFGDYARDYVIVPGFYPRQYDPRPAPATSTQTPLAPALTNGFDVDAANELIAADNYIEANKRTASDVLTLINDVIALATKYLDKYKKDPSVPITELLKELQQDTDYKTILAELRHYRQLRYGLEVSNFYHPLVCAFRKLLNGSGVSALMARDTQLTDTGFDFAATYQPGPEVIEPYPREIVDFQLDGAYSSYNWELFFHVPFDVAMMLNQDQQFDKARDWFHYVFNPVGIGDYPLPSRFWNTKPFFLTTATDYLNERIDSIMNAIAADPSGATISDLAFAVAQWRDNPFKPDVVARSRPVAYQMAIVINYVQNLIDWGDNLFRQFTRESVTQATQLYVLADKLLGPKPQIIPPAVPVPDMTYQQLRGELDLFSNALLDLENLVPDVNALPHHGAELPPSGTSLTSLYFCIPPNETLLQKWDLVADRLFKIRNCQNIDGIPTPLALFSPPIDPGALVRAVAAGLDITQVLAGLGAPLPHYHFTTMAGKAKDLAQQVAGLGSELTAALEKKNAERLANLRQTQEIAVLNAMRTVKLASIEEAKGAVTGLQRAQDVIEQRIVFYSSQPFMNTGETTAVALNATSLLGEAAVALGYTLAGGLRLIPDFMAGAAGFGGSPTVNATLGGQSIGNSAEMAAATLSSLTRVADKSAAMASTQGGYQRRQDEWNFQLALAQKELAQNQQQIANANLHLDTLAKDLQEHDLQIKNAQQLQQFMLTKFTNEELYNWMAAQVSSVYFQAYKLAYDTAIKAQRCYCYELARDDTFITYGYWNTQKKGLMTAHALLHDINRMEAAHLDNNIREYELTKHISLAQQDPFALLQLKTTGTATVVIPEIAFDLDHPTHYLRRIKTVSTSLLCNAGPYTTVGMTLSLITNKYRKTTDEAPHPHEYAEDVGNDDRFAYNVGTIASIATSTAVSDTGLFDLNFHDDRYLPFEGAGAISTWRIELPTKYPQFDYDTISDLILHIRYTAREGGSAFRKRVETALTGTAMHAATLTDGHQGLYAAYSLRESFPSEWWQLGETGATSITIDESHLPYIARGHNPTLTTYIWAAKVQAEPPQYTLTVNGSATALPRHQLMHSICIGPAGNPTLGTPVSISCDPTKLEDLWILAGYTIA